MTGTRLSAFLLLAAANLLWSGNWVAGRALRDAFDPITLNFWRWLIATLVLAPFALREVVRKRALIRRHAGLLLLLAFTGVTLFQSLVYLGLRTTTTINAVLLNSSAPLFMLLCSWVVERERASLRQVAGMMISLAGILVILSRGDFASLLGLRFQAGDAWILLAMPVWGLYSVLLRRRPRELGGAAFVLVVAAAGMLLLAPAYAFQALQGPFAWPTLPEALGVLYIALAASVVAFICWNRGVAIVGANAAGIATILAGVMLASYSENRLRAK